MSSGGDMTSPAAGSNLCCQIRIIRAENVELGRKVKGGGGCFFVRMYLSAGNNNGRVHLDTKDLPLSSTNGGGSGSSSFKWDQLFSLECNGKAKAVSQLRRGSVALELRWRPTSTMWGKASSKLLGRAELPWGPAFSSPIQAWVPLITTSTSRKIASFGSAPALLVAMTVNALQADAAEMESRRQQRPRRNGEEEGRCGCSGDHGGCGNTCQDDYQLFALAAAFEAF